MSRRARIHPAYRLSLRTQELNGSLETTKRAAMPQRKCGYREINRGLILRDNRKTRQPTGDDVSCAKWIQKEQDRQDEASKTSLAVVDIARTAVVYARATRR